MKFISIAQSFAAFAVISVSADKSNLRKLSSLETKPFLQAKPENPKCNTGKAWAGECTCRDGHVCYTTEKCVDRGVGGSCEKRTSDNTRSGDEKSCRNGEKCINNNTACKDGSKCKNRNSFTAAVVRKLDLGSFLQAKPEDERCNKGEAWAGDCTCRDGHVCYTTEKCVDRGVGGSCEKRTSDNTRSGDEKSCRNGEKCINNNTACEDGSKCKDRDGFAAAVVRKLDLGSFLQAKPEDKRCRKGEAWAGDCTCRDGHVCYTTEKCEDRNVSGSCAWREPEDNRSGDRMSCRDGEKCIKNNTACKDGSKCKNRNSFLQSE